MAGVTYQGNAGALQSSQFPSHASYLSKPYPEAVQQFTRYFMQSAIDFLDKQPGRAVTYDALAGLTGMSRAVERKVKDLGLEPYMKHHHTEYSQKYRLPKQKIPFYTDWKKIKSLEGVVSPEEILAGANVNPDVKVAALADWIVAEARLKGNYDIKSAVKKFQAAYVAGVVMREAQQLTLHYGIKDLGEAKEHAARYLKTSTKTIDRMLDEAEEQGYIARSRQLKDYTYNVEQLIRFRNPVIIPGGLESQMDRAA
ncbi:hypothetical protein HYV81_01245 [Candidatus Woesearchaeota archaeon]|nr:hypothetical protein [Candidatus Woesearchaeota archaeon]